jgi:hypothetical protein
MTMSFMEPQLIFDDWIEVDGPNGIDFIPADLVGEIGRYHGPYVIPTPAALRDYTENETVSTIKKIKGWGIRMSAPGYLDCTPWAVYGSVLEALEGLVQQYGDEEEDLAGYREAIDIESLFREGHLADADRPKLVELGLLYEPEMDEQPIVVLDDGKTWSGTNEATVRLVRYPADEELSCDAEDFTEVVRKWAIEINEAGEPFFREITAE